MSYLHVDMDDHIENIREYAKGHLDMVDPDTMTIADFKNLFEAYSGMFEEAGVVRAEEPHVQLSNAVNSLHSTLDAYKGGTIDYYQMYKEVTRALGPFHTAYYAYRDEVLKGNNNANT